MIYKIAVLIPAFQPDDFLCKIIEEIRDYSLPTLVVDDGSGDEYTSVFNKALSLGAEVIRFDTNRGKGAALKSGFKYLKELGYDAVITADSDGKHISEDIIEVSRILRENRNSFVIGTRNLSELPLQYRAINKTTARLFRGLYGTSITDTQSGLRGIPLKNTDRLLKLRGEHYEYEMNMLINHPKLFDELIEIPIETVYKEGNPSSHFRPIYDNAKIYAVLLKSMPKFLFSSFSSFCIDYLLFAFFIGLTGGRAVFSTIFARLFSGCFNFTVNKFFVFGKSKSYTLIKYLALAGCILTINCLLISFATGLLNIPPLIAKVIIEITMYFINFTMQNRFAQEKIKNRTHRN